MNRFCVVQVGEVVQSMRVAPLSLRATCSVRQIWQLYGTCN